jgi:hypothetical protein
MGFRLGGPGGRAGRAGVACRGGVAAGAVTATLICACTVRRSVAGRMVPLTSTGNHQGAHRGDGDRSCRGERPARHRLGGSPGPGSGGGHLGPHEPGQLAANRGRPPARPCRRAAGAGTGRAGAAAPSTTGPGSSAEAPAWRRASRADRRGVPEGPGRLGQRGPDRLGAGLGDVPAADPLPGDSAVSSASRTARVAR